MLNKPVDEIVLENGRVVGVKSEGEVPYTLLIIYTSVRSSPSALTGRERIINVPSMPCGSLITHRTSIPDFISDSTPPDLSDDPHSDSQLPLNSRFNWTGKELEY